MTRILYGRGQSRSFRCLWALNEADVGFEYVDITAETAPANYADLNPQGKVPALVDEDMCLTESAAIVNYVGMLVEESNFIPASLKLRARYDEMSYFVMTELEQPLWTIGKHRFAIPEEFRHAVMFETAAWEFEKAQNTLEHLMSSAEYAVGDKFSFADLLLSHTINWAERFGMQVDQRWLDYRDNHYQRPACQRSLEQVS